MAAGVTLAVAAFAGGAYAATQSNSNPRQAFLDDVAKRLNVTPGQLDSALKAAFLDRLDAAVKAGVITQAQANRIKQRLDSGARVPFLFGPRVHPRAGILGSAASYLGLSDAQLIADLRSGKTLAQIAKAQGKSVSGLEQAITADVKARLDKAAAAGWITKSREDQILSRLRTRISSRVNEPLPRFGPRFGRNGMPPGPAFAPGPPPGGPAGVPPGAPLPPPGA